MLLDSNILIYASKIPAQKGITDKAMALAEQKGVCISAISYLEVLGYYKLKDDEKANLTNILEQMTVFMISEQVIEQAITLRQQKSLSLGDAIIAATALLHKQDLYTRNTDDFSWIDGLTLVNPFETSSSHSPSKAN